MASAQTSVSGRAADTLGAAIPGVTATLRALPAAGAAVMPNMPNMPNMPAPIELTATGDANGAFRFDGVKAGEYVLMVDLPGFERSSQAVTVANQPLMVDVVLTALEIPGAESVSAGAAPVVDTAALLNRIKQLEQRIEDIESTAILSEPETRVKRIEVYVDKNNNVHDEPVPGAAKQVTYQRERVYRRQWLSEKLEQAFADKDATKIAVGVSAASVTQFAHQTTGAKADANDHAYQLASADLLFAGGIAQYTSFFADVVGLSGAPPDAEIHGLTLLNSYTARLVRQNEVNVREAWVRTELFNQVLGLSAGRLDLTNTFDRNAFANDETTQFISDGLVNNPMLGLGSNGAGVAAVIDPKGGLAFKAGFQQSNSDATNLSQSLFSLAEVDYVARPKGLSEGSYRVWGRNDNTTARNKAAFGLSFDQKMTPFFGLFARYGRADANVDHDRFYSTGFQVQNAAVINPLDFWGVGFADTKLGVGDRERVAEGYYNFLISEKLRLSLHLQHAFERPMGAGKSAFILPAIRLQARF